MIDLLSIAGGGLVASLLVQVVKIIAGKIEGRWGSLITQIVLLASSILVAGIGLFANLLPAEIVNTVLGVFVSGMAIYEIIFKAIYQQAIKGA